METSLRLGGESKSLRIHAKEKFPLSSNFLFQAHGEIDTSIAAPSYLAILMRGYFPELSAKIGVGVHYDDKKQLGYTLRGKKSFPLTSNGLVGVNIKGLLLTDQEYDVKEKLGAVELSWSIFNFRRNQDVRLKVGYEMLHKMPYFQVRENNWTINAFLDGKWNLRYDL
ncbi:outer envelope pore 21B-like protein [Carex rostrata]